MLLVQAQKASAQAPGSRQSWYQVGIKSLHLLIFSCMAQSSCCRKCHMKARLQPLTQLCLVEMVTSWKGQAVIHKSAIGAPGASPAGERGMGRISTLPEVKIISVHSYPDEPRAGAGPRDGVVVPLIVSGTLPPVLVLQGATRSCNRDYSQQEQRVQGGVGGIGQG